MNSRLLLVEDEPGLVVTLSDLLQSEGYQVETATNGEAGLSRALMGGSNQRPRSRRPARGSAEARPGSGAAAGDRGDEP